MIRRLQVVLGEGCAHGRNNCASACVSQPLAAPTWRNPREKSNARRVVTVYGRKGSKASVESLDQPEPGPTGVVDAPASPALPVASRSSVLMSCTTVSAILALVGIGLHIGATTLGMGQAELLQVPSGLSVTDAGVAIGTSAAVTAARIALLSVWLPFQEATDKSLGQPADIAYISVLPGVSEELLFRGGLLPLFPNPWVGVAIAGGVFGLLHNNGGRNLAFSAWASAVGVAYGVAFVVTGNLLVPCLSHALSNAASAFWWRSTRGASA